MTCQESILKEVTIREYHKDDWLLTCSIHDAARPIELKGSCDPRAFVPLAEDTSELEDFHRSQKFVACINNDVVGFVGVDEDEVTWLYVDPSMSGKGIGRRLLQKGLAIIRTNASCYVLEGNTPARKLYASEGFKVVHQFNSENNGYPCSVLKLSQ